MRRRSCASKVQRMAVEVAAGRALTGLGLRAVLRDVLAGAICSILSVAYCLSYAALIFSGLLANWLSYGIAATFLSATIAAAIIALRSSFPFAIAGPDTSTSAVTATLAASTAARLAAEGNANLLPSTLIVVALATAATGILLCVLGYAKAGRAIRFVPYPVIGGFLGATGWFMISGAVQLDERLCPARYPGRRLVGDLRRTADRRIFAGRCTTGRLDVPIAADGLGRVALATG